MLQMRCSHSYTLTYFSRNEMDHFIINYLVSHSSNKQTKIESFVMSPYCVEQHRPHITTKLLRGNSVHSIISVVSFKML